MKGKKLVWAVDCDDVIVPTAQVIVTAYNEQYATNLELKDFYNKSNDNWGTASGDESIRRVSELLREGVTDRMAPSQETIDALTRLASVDELHMVTGRQSFLEEVTRHMIDTYLPGVFTSVEHTNYLTEKGSGLVSRSKGEVCAAIGADVLIDDHVDHAYSVLEHGLKEVVIWGDYPWNHNQELVQGMVRCTSWEEVFRERERILAGRK